MGEHFLDRKYLIRLENFTPNTGKVWKDDYLNKLKKNWNVYQLLCPKKFFDLASYRKPHKIDITFSFNLHNVNSRIVVYIKIIYIYNGSPGADPGGGGPGPPPDHQK